VAFAGGAGGVQGEQFGGGIVRLFGRLALGFSHWPEPSVCSGALPGRRRNSGNDVQLGDRTKSLASLA
jgi:hypothetical protein